LSKLSADTVVGVIGLGYVGLPVALAFGRRFRTFGYDLSAEKIAAYRRGVDPAGEVEADAFRAASKISFSADPAGLREVDFIIVAVPTPVDAAHQPDFRPLVGASATAGAHLKTGATVVYESTVYPGATEEVCVPVLEEHSRREWRRDFHVGYSPERINPGDGQHRLETIVKVVAGDDEPTLERVAALYGAIVTAGVHRVSSIRVAEAAKVIENTQRDLNIALMNELAIIFDRMGIDSGEVLRASATKWNFLPFRPGLVGGHCIGVDPYYLTHKAEMLGYHPQIILAGRRINDGMGKFVAEKTVRLMAKGGSPISGASVNVLGLTFKENISDLRNSRVPDIVRELRGFGIQVNVHDPLADGEAAKREYGLELRRWDELPAADALVLAVAHRQFVELPAARLAEKVKPGGSIIDVKSCLDPAALRAARLEVWRL
jgi:UDP-N-acetyl-D-galactosamine dehydrogenase